MANKRLTLQQKKGIMGMFFVSPWFIGSLLFFTIPLVASFRYSLSNLELAPDGFSLSFEGISNYKQVLLEHADYNRLLTESVLNMVVNVPLILILSLFFATLLNQKFRGRAIARAIFFLPVILASGVIAMIESGDFLQQMMQATTSSTTENFSLLKSFQLERMLIESGLNITIVEYLTGAVNRIYEIISLSGVQMLIFLAGLQSISPSLYEAARIEGATGYEIFWKITFPMVSPLIITNVIYTVIDSFTNNNMTTLIQETAFKTFDFGLSAAMSWIYFLIISIILLITAAIISKRVFYHD